MSVKHVPIVAACVVLLSAAAALAGSTITKPATIRVTDQEVRRTYVDLSPRGESAGDLESIRTLLYNKRITPKAIGHGELVCTATGTGSTMCNGTYFLPRGKIVVGGVVANRLIYELAVLGGTGLYDNARGTLTVTSLDRKPPRNLLLFRLVG